MTRILLPSNPTKLHTSIATQHGIATNVLGQRPRPLPRGSRLFVFVLSTDLFNFPAVLAVSAAGSVTTKMNLIRLSRLKSRGNSSCCDL